jgi:hypothetical protein
MKKEILIFVMLLFFLNAFTLSKQMDNVKERQLYNSSFHQTGNILLRVSNCGCIGSGNTSPRFPSLTWPKNYWFNEAEDLLGTDYLYQGSLWIGAKKVRRNENGEILYWLPNPVDENDCIPASHPAWNSAMLTVVDTLSSVGFDGDLSLLELLPAFNPLEASTLGQEYFLYNNYDRVFFSRYGTNEIDDNGLDILAGIGFPYFSTDNIYCSGLGSESSVAYYYDYSPFPNGYSGDRDWGSSSGSSKHYPLQIAVKQETFTWPVQYYSDVIFIKYTIYNSSVTDTLYDLTLGFYMDHDIGPVSLGSGLIGGDDLTAFVSGEGMEFPYSYDADGDEGLSPGKVALKVLSEAENFACWYWNLGQGPDDSNPRNLNPTGPTANQKYWLMKGRNPDFSKYTDLTTQNQTIPGDTRYLYSIYGDMQGMDNPTEHSINLGPGEQKEIVSAIFLANTVDELISLAELINEFYASGFDENVMAGLPSFPYLMSVDIQETTAYLEWKNFTIPDELYVYYKLRDAPASTWQEIVVNHETTELVIYDLDETQEHKFKLGAYFGNVYLESNTITAGSALASQDDDTLPVSTIEFISIYPNPFNPATTIAFELAVSSDYKISIFNVKGQKIFTYNRSEKVTGKQNYLWNGRDDSGNSVTSGIYFFRIESGKENVYVKKAVLMK